MNELESGMKLELTNPADSCRAT